MSSVKAIFKKQIKDIYKNTSVLIQFIIYPVVAFAMTALVARGDMVNTGESGMSENMFITMMASVFVGMGLIPFVANIVAEDKEKKSLRFLVMAGVKPYGYLLGIGGVVFFASLFPALAFTIMGRFSGEEFWIFLAVLMSGVVASTILGLAIGIHAKNQQAATGLAMPAAMVLGFGPIIAPFNAQVERIFSFFYTQQLNVVMDSFYSVTGHQSDTGLLLESFGIIGANIAVLIVLFVIAFAKKGLNG